MPIWLRLQKQLSVREMRLLMQKQLYRRYQQHHRVGLCRTIVSETSQDWDIALSSYDDAKKCSVKIMKTTNASLQEDYQALLSGEQTND